MAAPPSGASAPLPLDRLALPPGVVIADRYVVEELLGRGGMGTVYAAHDTRTGTPLALKVLHPALAANAQAVERFKTEVRAPLRIATQNVVRILDADVSVELGGVPFIVMERLVGRDLGNELRLRGALPAGEVTVLLAQVAAVLDRAHSMGIVHRDLKPANLFVERRDDGAPLVKVLDFGVAKLADQASGELTQDGTIFGTPWYMAPEQASGQARRVGPPADRWALGLIAYRLLTGRNYWTAEGIAPLIAQILYEPMRPPSESAPHVGPLFDLWFARACNRDPDQRFGDATEQIRHLARALGVSAAGAGELTNSAIGATMHIDIQMPGARPAAASPAPPALGTPPAPMGPSAHRLAAPAAVPLAPPPAGLPAVPWSTGVPVTTPSAPPQPASRVPIVPPRLALGAVVAAGTLLVAGVAGVFVLRGPRNGAGATAPAASATTLAAAAAPPASARTEPEASSRSGPEPPLTSSGAAPPASASATADSPASAGGAPAGGPAASASAAASAESPKTAKSDAAKSEPPKNQASSEKKSDAAPKPTPAAPKVGNISF